jgi:hypothetical protein
MWQKQNSRSQKTTALPPVVTFPRPVTQLSVRNGSLLSFVEIRGTSLNSPINQSSIPKWLKRSTESTDNSQWLSWQKQKWSIKCYMLDTYTWQRPSIFIRDKPIFSSDRMLHKDYYRKGSVAKKYLWSCLQGAWSPDEMIGGNPSVVK